MQNKYCSKCGKTLDIEDKSSGKCHSCGEPIKNTVKVYDFYLETVGNNEEKCVALISEILSLSLESAEKKVENMPLLLLKNGTERQINALRAKFSDLQAKIVIKAHYSEVDNVSQNTTISQNSFQEKYNPSKSKKSNGTSDALGICGIIIIIIGVIFSIQFFKEEFQYFLLSIFVSVVTGLFFIGMAEIIQLLDDIKHKLLNNDNEKISESEM